jgi:type VI secretion system protein ImpC
VDREVVTSGDRPRQVTQPVETPADWNQPAAAVPQPAPAPPGSSQGINRMLQRVRRPRVQINYEAQTGEGMEKFELPFVVGVLADLSGSPATPLPKMKDRRFVDIGKENLDEVLQRCAPRLVLQVPNRLSEQGGTLSFELHFQSVDDFAPDRVAQQAFPQDRGALDAGHTAQLREILHHAEFRKLEGTWRGLKYLVDQSETGTSLKIRVLNATKKELLEDFRKARDFDLSQVFKKVYEDAFGWDRQPYGLLVGDYAFDRTADDLDLLRSMARVAAEANTFLVTTVSPQFLGLGSFKDLLTIDLAAVLHALAADAGWRGFRTAPEARHVALTLPRVLARLPYGAGGESVEAFPFEEFDSDPDPDQLVWMNPAWTYAARITDAYAQHGWFTQSAGADGGGNVEGLPTPSNLSGVMDWAITPPHESALLEAGLLPLGYYPTRGGFYFPNAHTCQERGPDIRTSQLNHLLGGARFMHYLQVQLGYRLGALPEDEVERWVDCWLGRWLDGFVLAHPENAGPEMRTRKPLAGQHLTVRAAPWGRRVTELIADLQFHTALGPPVALRLVAHVSR